MGWEWKDPWFWLVAVLAPVIYWFATRLPSMVGYSTLRIADQSPPSLRARFSKLPAILLAVSVLFLAGALARPRTPDAETEIHREGISIMMVLDRSGSMQAVDMVQGDTSVDRLEAVKEVFREFVLGESGTAGEGRPDDMIGVVGFARYADSLCPLTLDHGNLTSLVGDIEIVTERSEDGTAIGDGLALAIERLRENKAKSKVAILLTDGVSNSGVISPTQAADLAASHDIKVYCIGVGTDGVAPFPVTDPFTGRKVLRRIPVQIDEDTLKEIAAKTDGRYFRATDKEALAEIYAEIDRLEKTEITEIRYLQYTEHYAFFVWVAMILIVAATISSETLFRRLP